MTCRLLCRRLRFSRQRSISPTRLPIPHWAPLRPEVAPQASASSPMLWGKATLLLPLVLWPMAPVATRGLRGRRTLAAPGGRDKVIWVGLAVRGRVALAWAALAARLELELVA